MRIFFSFSVCIIAVMCLCGCFGSETKVSIADNSSKVIDEQTEQIKDLIVENEMLLIDLQGLTDNMDLANVTVNEDGFFVWPDKRELWVNGVSNRVKELYSCQKDTCSINIGFATEEQVLSTHLEIEIYYPENHVLYTVVYCTSDPCGQGNSYMRLNNNWCFERIGLT